jgi:hypothetical protein
LGDVDALGPSVVRAREIAATCELLGDDTDLRLHATDLRGDTGRDADADLVVAENVTVDEVHDLNVHQATSDNDRPEWRFRSSSEAGTSRAGPSAFASRGVTGGLDDASSREASLPTGEAGVVVSILTPRFLTRSSGTGQ